MHNVNMTVNTTGYDAVSTTDWDNAQSFKGPGVMRRSLYTSYSECISLVQYLTMAQCNDLFQFIQEFSKSSNYNVKTIYALST